MGVDSQVDEGCHHLQYIRNEISNKLYSKYDNFSSYSEFFVGHFNMSIVMTNFFHKSVKI